MNEWKHVDSILEHDIGQRALGEKLIKEEGFLEGHFPGRPIQPGVLTLEGLLEVAGVIISGRNEAEGKKGLRTRILRIEMAKFMDVVLPGDKLFLEVQAVKWGEREVHFKGRASVGKATKAEARFVLGLF